MAYVFKVDHLPKGHRNRPGYPMKPKGLIFHTTNNWNKGATDEMHAEYMENTNRVVSWHETVDRDSCTQHIPHTENAWHAGDGGNGHYNRNWLGMEIACNSTPYGEKIDDETYNNAVRRAAEICKQYNFAWAQLQPHKIVYGKNCPHNTLFDHETFKKDVFLKVAEMSKKPAAKPVVKTGDGYLYVVQKGDTLTEIAEAHDKAVDYLVRLNKLEDPDKIYVGQRIQLQGKAPEPKKKEVVKPASNKKRIYLPPTASSWRIYPLSKAPVKANALSSKLNPKKFGGLSYEILGMDEPYTYIIQTSNFGKVKIYGHPSTGAVIK